MVSSFSGRIPPSMLLVNNLTAALNLPCLISVANFLDIASTELTGADDEPSLDCVTFVKQGFDVTKQPKFESSLKGCFMFLCFRIL